MAEAALAEPGQRLLARVVDTLVVGVPVIIIVRELVSRQALDVVAPPAVAGCMLLYEAIQLAIWGRTLGKRLAGIEVVVAVPGATARKVREGQATTPPSREPGADARPEAATAAPSGGSPATELGAGSGAETTSEAPSETAADPTAAQGRTQDVEPEEGAETVIVPIGERGRLDVVRALARAAVYSLPIAARPIPVAGLLAGIFWVANAGALYEGTLRQAVHDRLTGTLVVKRSSTDSSAF